MARQESQVEVQGSGRREMLVEATLGLHVLVDGVIGRSFVESWVKS